MPIIWAVISVIALATFVGWTKKQDSFEFQPALHIDDRRAAKARVFLFPGMPGTSSQWTEQPQRELRELLLQNEIEVISLAVPLASPGNFVKGQAYRDGFSNYVRQTLGKVDHAHGRKGRTIVGGISYGGLHAMMAAALFPSDFTEWFASFPVVKLSALSGYAHLGEVKAFDPAQFSTALGQRRGLLMWGTSDSTVGWTATKEFFGKLDRNLVTGIEYPDVPHQTSKEQVAEIVRWVGRTQ